MLLLRQKQLAEKAPSLDQIRAQARDNWLAMRASNQAKGKAPEASREASVEKEQSTRLTLDAQRKEAVQHWLKYRQETQNPEPPKEPEKGVEQGPNRSKGLDGPEIE